MEVDFDEGEFVAGAAIAETAAGKHQHDQRREQQHAARGREFFENGPEKFPDHVQTMAATGEPLWRFGGYIARIETVAGARVGFELRPELGQFQSFGDSLLEPAQPKPEGKVFRGSGLGWWGS